MSGAGQGPKGMRGLNEYRGEKMQNKSRWIPALALLLSACTPPAGDTGAGTRAAETSADTPLAVMVPGSGAYSRPISTSVPEAQAFFDQGLRLAWGFYFPESIASYQEAARLDPGSPMPHWGMAHAMGPNPNSRYARMPDDPQGEGRKAIKRAMALIDRASPLEAELIKAMYILYNRAAIPDDQARDRAYLAAMRQLNREHPDDPDIAALYAAAYMSIGRWDYWDKDGRAKDETLPVAEALEHIIRKDRTHPGVLHLHIHLIEASLEPERALVSADALEATVPIGGHIVHMPAHIYVRVGQYDRAIESNIRSQEVDKKFAAIWGDNHLPNIGTYPLSHRIHSGHALDFIRYAATVQGNYAVAIDAARKVAAGLTEQDMPMRGQKAVAAPWLVLKIFGRWDEILAIAPEHSGTPYLDGILAYATGSAHLGKGDLPAAKEQLARLQAIAGAPDADDYRVGATPASAVLRLAAHGLEGELLMAEGDLKAAIAAFRAGVAIEDQNNYTEPPDWAQPMRHYLGAALLKAGDLKEAEQVYRRDLRWNQNNGWSLLGLHQALKAQGRLDEAGQYYDRWQAAWAWADVDITASHL